MFLSLFDIFKIGIGPSSSHTMGPMVAAARFLERLRGGERIPGAGDAARLGCRLHGSLAFTGRGHATDRAVILGLAGFEPATIDAARAEAALARIAAEAAIEVPGLGRLGFDPAADLVFDYGPALERHANALVLSAWDGEGNLHARETYYSIGGGFVLTEAEMDADPQLAPVDGLPGVPYPFASAAEMLEMAARSGLSIAEMKRANEATRIPAAELDARIDRVIAVMMACIDRGLAAEGILPGGLKVRRRARRIHDQLVEERGRNLSPPHICNDWLSAYAMAVNEENAAGGQVVTSPTNGAAGVFPSVLRYFQDHMVGATRAGMRDMLLTGAAIGGLVKHNASISGAECGCQAEVGSASAMAAAGLCAAMGGSPEQVENAAEIALEHHLGMTCDPVKGLVQVPCIERNGLGAIKAVSAASLALRGDGGHIVSLDACIATLRDTGRDMSEKYKETSLGGLAVNVPDC
ncbi:L-serine ammonia-lyase [Paralimibaculum aggregatum]|uniref:L-serine dehydratase n=1 Tax=Paralimibaculum aggregatum TaxID=3036245 RepID=A0ABQ6LRW9_9RHOB|nr:L-serine ammonia-lyase [Limibaculum sp. NKW23]GMG84713.1 L-serine ammonia-lyase [Limibaculum sp. NKW23]